MDCQSELFEIPSDITYLNCAYVSPLLKSLRGVAGRVLDARAMPWKIRPADFFSETDRYREVVGRLIGSDGEGIAIIPSVSYGVALAAANIPVAKGQHIVLLEDQFPSNVYGWRELARKRQAEIVTVKRPADFDWTGVVLGAIDENTAVVSVPHCHWIDGSKVDLVAVGRRVRQVGAALVVDATQSLGVYPFDVNDIQPDFLIVAGYKWLLGPYGLSFVYVAPKFRGGEPLEHHWLTRQGSDNFARLVEYQQAYAPGARRFDMGQRSQFHLIPLGIAALEQIHDWGVSSIEAYLSRLTDLIEARAKELKLGVVPQTRRGAHLIGIHLPSRVSAEALAAALAKERVYVSVRSNTLRVAPHVYNTEKDTSRLFEVLERTLN